MASGGARNRSGPKATEDSGRSDRRGFKLTALPSEGFMGEAPEFPLPGRTVFYTEWEDKHPVRVLDGSATEHVEEREAALWAWVWSTPQACAWSMPSERWRQYSVAMWVRTAVICESSDATAADKNSLHRFSDQIGMTTAGLAEMGWKVAVDEVTEKAATKKASKPASSRDRLKIVGSGT